jgi:hypothetical protein
MKPGACMDTLIASSTGDIEYLTNKDITVLGGGTNGVNKNNSQCGLSTFVEISSHTNIILESVPHRYDLSD